MSSRARPGIHAAPAPQQRPHGLRVKPAMTWASLLLRPQLPAGRPVGLLDVVEDHVHALGLAAKGFDAGLGERLHQLLLLLAGAAFEHLDADGGHGVLLRFAWLAIVPRLG